MTNSYNNIEINNPLKQIQQHYDYNKKLLKEKESEIDSSLHFLSLDFKQPEYTESGNNTMSDFDMIKDKSSRAEKLKFITDICKNYILSIKDKVESLDFSVETMINTRNYSDCFHLMEIDYHLKIYRMIFNELFFMEFNIPNAFCTEENIVKYLFSIEKDENQHIKIIPCYGHHKVTKLFKVC